MNRRGAPRKFTDLATDAGQYDEQFLIGLRNVATDEADDADDLAPQQDRKSNGRTQYLAFGDVRAAKRHVMPHIRNLRGRTGFPDTPCQSASFAACTLPCNN